MAPRVSDRDASGARHFCKTDAPISGERPRLARFLRRLGANCLVARLTVCCNSCLKGDAVLRARRVFSSRSSANKLRILCILVVSVLIGGDQVPTEMSKVTPAVENHPAIKRLCFSRHDHAIVFHPRAGVRFPPVKFESLEF